MKIEVKSLPDGSLVVGCVIPRKDQMSGIKNCIDDLFSIESVVLRKAGIRKGQKQELAEAVYVNISEEGFRQLSLALEYLLPTIDTALYDIMYALCDKSPMVVEIKDKLNEAAVALDDAEEAAEEAKRELAEAEKAENLLKRLGYKITKNDHS